MSLLLVWQSVEAMMVVQLVPFALATELVPGSVRQLFQVLDSEPELQSAQAPPSEKTSVERLP